MATKIVNYKNLPGWDYIYEGYHNLTIVGKANGFKDSEPSYPVEVYKAPTYAVNIYMTNGSYWGPSVIQQGGSITINLYADNGYVLPDNITDIYGASYTYDKNNGTITLYDPYDWIRLYIDCEVAPQPVSNPTNWLTFSSPSSFSTSNTQQLNYDGTIYYSTDTVNWNTWDGSTVISSANDGTSYKLYLAGSGNTHVNFSQRTPLFSGSDIDCSGNIESLLDFATVANGQHPAMGNSCFRNLFAGSPLISCPTFPATTISNNAYASMFRGCTSLQMLPALPATTLEYYCYYSMFYECSNIAINSTQSGTDNEYRIPLIGTGTDNSGGQAMTSMFKTTGGSVTGTPSINTTYYTPNAIRNTDGTITPASN